jgi:uncharacterized protein
MAVKKAAEFSNPPDYIIREILKECRTVAVVGLSDDPERPSRRVGEFLKDHGYRIVPVNPKLETVLGEKCYASLTDIPFRVDIVDVFRRPEHVPLIADEAARIGAKVLWLQLGVVNVEAAGKHGKDMTVVMDRCMAIEYRRLLK